MVVARNPAKLNLRTAQRFEFAAVASMLPRQIEQLGSVIHQCPGCSQGLTRRGDKRRSSGHIESHHVRRCHRPASICRTRGCVARCPSPRPASSASSRTVSRIPDKPLWLEAEALLCPLDHGLCRTDFGLPNGAGGLDVNDNAELHIDEIVVGVSKECRPLVSPGPLRCRSDGGTNFGTTSLAAPHAVSSRVARYSFTARLDLAGSRSLRQS